MPDTTYHLYPNENSQVTMIKIPGGKDTDIWLNHGELPAGLDSFILFPEKFTTITVPSDNGPRVKQIEHYVPGNTMIFTFLALFIYAAIRVIRESKDHWHHFPGEFKPSHQSLPVADTHPVITIGGEDIHITDEMAIPVLEKHFPYFNTLGPASRQKFLFRLKRFAEARIFKIHDASGFREMPVLVSAAAIQLSFGLENYLLPDFPYIHIFPLEFLGIRPNIRFLEGNVTDGHIRISWKHFLEGFELPGDGQNVGLHEMAHAYYFQNFEAGRNIDTGFVNAFPKYNIHADKVFHAEQTPGNDLYSDYALKNFQEFWAESVEIFFEKPVQLKNSYPTLYAALAEVLNQHPAET